MRVAVVVVRVLHSAGFISLVRMLAQASVAEPIIKKKNVACMSLSVQTTTPRDCQVGPTPGYYLHRGCVCCCCCRKGVCLLLAHIQWCGIRLAHERHRVLQQHHATSRAHFEQNRAASARQSARNTAGQVHPVIIVAASPEPDGRREGSTFLYLCVCGQSTHRIWLRDMAVLNCAINMINTAKLCDDISHMSHVPAWSKISPFVLPGGGGGATA